MSEVKTNKKKYKKKKETGGVRWCVSEETTGKPITANLVQSFWLI